MKRLATRLARNPLVQNAAALYGVQIVRKVLPLIIVPYLARTLGAAGWGVVAFTLSMAELMVLLIEFGFNLSATREVARARDSGEECGAIMSGVLGAQVLLATVGVLCAIVASRFIPLLRDQPKLLASGLFYAVAQGFIPLWFFQGLERMRLAAAIEASGRIAGLVCIFLFVRSPQDAWLALLLQGAAPAFTTLAGLTMAYRQSPWGMPSWWMVRDALRRGWTLFVFRSGEILYGAGSAFILGLFAAPAQVGYFASAEKISRAIFGLLNPIRDALYPRLAHVAHRSPEEAAPLARAGMALMISGGLVLGGSVFLLAPFLINLLVGADFGPAVIVLRILSLLPPLLAITHSVGLQWLLPLGRDAAVNRVVLTTGAFNLVLAVLLAPHFAHEGMAWAVVCSEALACASLVILTVRSMSRLRPVRFSQPAVSQTFET